ncbi:MAG: CopG family transcriptional regulator, partial [Gammaproteobacteria bacterium HGW-Gammaproteobacteria-10]
MKKISAIMIMLPFVFAGSLARAEIG